MRSLPIKCAEGEWSGGQNLDLGLGEPCPRARLNGGRLSMARCRWSGKAPSPARGFQGATKTTIGRWGAGECEMSPRVIQRQDADHGGLGGAWRFTLSAIERRTFVHGAVSVEREGSKSDE
jgi:hypothetical protein